MNHKISGKNTLTSDSFILCKDIFPLGRVKVLTHNDTRRRFKNDGHLNDVDFSISPIIVSVAKASESPEKAKTVAADHKNSNSKNETVPPKTYVDSALDEQSPKNMTENESEKMIISAYKCGTCQKKGCKYRKEGEIDWEKLSAEVNSQSLVLRSNYMQELQDKSKNSADIAFEESKKRFIR